MDDIRIDVGVDTILEVDLSTMDFTGVESVVFTVKNMLSVKAEPIVERTLTEAKKYALIITAEESLLVNQNAQYDFQKILLDGTRLKITDNGKVILRKSVGDKFDD